MENPTTPEESGHLVDVAPYDADSRYRRVRFRGSGWESLEREEFEPRVRREFPDIDLDDPEQVHWADRPGEWPPWHPGEA
ncbi:MULTISPECIES: hypothetical protein [Streptomyces]|uniref:Uncharacterized protein n=1 Tax=Streptomyces chengmaiensis TaxID=3040919 RepID=A0ABT6HML2_9ACTN|nr:MULTISPECIES: hypothetical protein [Streptomyces]MDH2389289.1 hypothetical protein [Streptomyces chengmaiensis]WRQ80426.1 hypothetical protein I3F59_014310 [Streptomyces sp. MUM 178J]